MNKRGFTLLELLIAAAILGALAMMATQALRSSSADIRLKDMQVRARTIATAARRFKIEHPGAHFDTINDQGNLFFQARNLARNANDCITGGSETGGVQNLINCGFLEFRQYMDGNFIVKFKDDSGTVCLWANPSGKMNNLGTTKYCTDGESDWTEAGE